MEVDKCMKRKIAFEDLKEELEFYVECPECDKELVVNDIFIYVRCPHCGWIFRPYRILVRKKGHNNPSFRNFRVGGEEANAKDRTKMP